MNAPARLGHNPGHATDQRQDDSGFAAAAIMNQEESAGPPPAEVPGSVESYMTSLYQELRRMAESYLRSERADHTLQPTAIVHEAFLRLSKGMPEGFRNRVHFLAVASNTMRRVLVDYARSRAAKSRGGKLRKITLTDHLLADESRTVEILVLDRALERLGEADPEALEVVRLRFFGGLTEPEVATYMEFSLRKTQKLWAFARAWLRREMDTDPDRG